MKKKIIPMFVRDSCLIDKKMFYFFTDDYSIFSLVNVETGDTVFTKKIPFINGDSYQFDKISYDNISRNIIFTPLMADSVLFYNIDTGETNRIKLLDRFREKLSFCGGYIYKRYLFMFGVCYPVIARVDIESKEIEYIEGWSDNLQLNVDFYMGRHIVELNNHLMISLRYENTILELDPETMLWTLHKIGNREYGFWGLCLSQDRLVCSPTNSLNDIVIWNTKSHDCTYISIDVNESDRNEPIDVWCNLGKIYVFGLKGATCVDSRVCIVENSCPMISVNEDGCTYYDLKEKVIKCISKEENVNMYSTGIVSSAFLDIEEMVTESQLIGINDFIDNVVE